MYIYKRKYYTMLQRVESRSEGWDDTHKGRKDREGESDKNDSIHSGSNGL